MRSKASSTSTSPLTSAHYIPTLDGWRAIAILMVLACHSRDRLFGPSGIWPLAPLNSFLVHGVLGVDVFFGISGFLITRRLLDEYHREGRIDLPDFYWRRFFRILPAAWMYLAFVFLCGLAGVFAVAPDELKSCFFFWRNYDETFGWYTGQYWSLMIEEHFYLLWPAALVLLAPGRARWVAAVAALGIGLWRYWDVALRFMASVFPDSIPEHRTDSRLDSLLWSCVVAISFPLLSKALLRIRFGYLATFVFAALLLLCGVIRIDPAATEVQSILRPILIPLMIVSTVVFPQGLIGRCLDLSVMRFVGKISYSLYLWQQPFFILDSALVSGTRLAVWQYWPLAPALVLACALASYYFVERPMIRFGGILHRRLRKKTEMALPAKVPPHDPKDSIPMSRTRRMLGGLVMTYGYQALVMLTGFWLLPFYLGRIGQSDYGLWLVGTQLLTYLTLTDFGVVALLPLETAYATGRAGGAEKADDLPIIVGQTVRIVLWQMPLVMLIASVMWFTIPASWQHLRGPLAVILVGFIAGYPLRILPALLQGLQDLTFANGLQIVVWVLSTSSTVLMVVAGWNLYAIAIGWLLSQFLMAPACLYRLLTRFPNVLPRRVPPMVWSALRTQLGKGFWISVAQIAQLLMSNTDLLIIGRLLGPAAVVPYSITCKLAGVLANQAYLLIHTASPALCELKTGESRQRVFQALAALTQGMLTFSGLVFCIVVVINHWFVDSWVAARHYGEQYGGFALTVAFLASLTVRHWTTTTAYTVFCFDHQRRISLTNLADGFVTAGACLAFTSLWGVIGGPLGTLTGACLVSLPFNLWRIAKDTDATVPQLVRGMLGGWLWRFAVLVAGAIWVALHWSPKSIVEAVGTVAAVAAVYCLFMLPNLLRAPLGNYIRPLVSSFHAKFVALQIRFSS